MEENKKRKLIKILLWCLIGLALASIIAMSIATAVIKSKTDETNRDNRQIEDVLDEQISL